VIPSGPKNIGKVVMLRFGNVFTAMNAVKWMQPMKKLVVFRGGRKKIMPKIQNAQSA
jgi:hypothetical protein